MSVPKKVQKDIDRYVSDGYSWKAAYAKAFQKVGKYKAR
jgi:hypothetical protein